MRRRTQRNPQAFSLSLLLYCAPVARGDGHQALYAIDTTFAVFTSAVAQHMQQDSAVDVGDREGTGR